MDSLEIFKGKSELSTTPLRNLSHSGTKFFGSSSIKTFLQYKLTPGSILPNPNPSMFSVGVNNNALISKGASELK